MSTRVDLPLPGCTPTPLAAYLKALAVLRLVVEQGADPGASGYWQNDVFVLRTSLDKNALLEFFLQHYAPTPLIAPWNGGSGFYPKDNAAALNALAETTSERFAAYRVAISLARSLVGSAGYQESPKKRDKAAFLVRLRNQAGEPLLRWMDAAVILAEDNPRYPPLLGTGGNDGRLDFTNNFMQRLVLLFKPESGMPQDNTNTLLAAALLAEPTYALTSQAIGQFSPGDAGGPNATAAFEGEARVNPWDFVLMLEGAVLLAASAVRRLESGSSAILSAPFTVRSRAGTVGSAAENDDSDSRGEIWMPLWERPCSLSELNALLSEGRAALGTRPAQDGLDFAREADVAGDAAATRPAQDGLDFARAVAKLGVDRGLDAFQRYGFLKRSGKAFLATPLARVPVRRDPDADLIDDLDRNGWLPRLQRVARDDKTPNAFRALAKRLDAALFALTQRADRLSIQRVLRLLGRGEDLASMSPSLREQLAPVPGLSAAWALKADDGSAEFRIARALAGLLLKGNNEGKQVQLGLRPHLAPLRPDGQAWDEDSRLACWGPGPLARNLAALLQRRRLEAIRLGLEGEILASRTGATRDDVFLFLLGQTDDCRIAELAHGLACVEWFDLGAPQSSPSLALPTAYVLLKPFFTSEALLRARGWLAPECSFRLPAEMPLRLAADDVDAALRLAWQRLRALGKQLPGRMPPRAPRRGDGPRLLAALTIPLAADELAQLLKCRDLDSDEEPTASVPNLA